MQFNEWNDGFPAVPPMSHRFILEYTNPLFADSIDHALLEVPETDHPLVSAPLSKSPSKFAMLFDG